MPFFIASFPSDLIPNDFVDTNQSPVFQNRTKFECSTARAGWGHIMVTRRCVGPMLVTAHCFACHVTRNRLRLLKVRNTTCTLHGLRHLVCPPPPPPVSITVRVVLQTPRFCTLLITRQRILQINLLHKIN